MAAAVTPGPPIGATVVAADAAAMHHHRERELREAEMMAAAHRPPNVVVVEQGYVRITIDTINSIKVFLFTNKQRVSSRTIFGNQLVANTEC